jgi:hypothetical protein
MMRVQVVPPDGAIHLTDLLRPVLRLAQIHPGLRRILLELGVVGDRPAERGLRPELRRDLHVVAIVLRVRRRAVLEQVRDAEHQAAIGMIDDVGEQLAGRGLGLDAGDQLTARRAHHLDLHEREALVEGLDELLLWLGEIGSVVGRSCLPCGRRRSGAWPPKSCAEAGVPIAAVATPAAAPAANCRRVMRLLMNVSPFAFCSSTRAPDA